ncbi:MAG: diguanylate cyclase [Halofilum sp. (in: g-proteobacteria)]|nr:diguanylate cyclase [Halofilum sp. (in: g-proteobacteria)]
MNLQDRTQPPSSRFPDIVAPGFREEAESLLAGIVDTISDAVVAVDDAQRIVVFNRGAQEMFGYQSEQILGQPLARLMPSDSRARHETLIAEFANESAPSRRMGERRTIHGLRSDGSRFPAGATIARMEGSFGQVFVAIVRDISAHVETREHLRASLQEQEQLARTDPLTGLWNTRAFGQALEQELARLRRNGRPFTLVYLDLDRFKPVNDRYGHAFGDTLIRETARRLQEYFRAMDTVARIGGDEFVVLSPDSEGGTMHTRLERLGRSGRTCKTTAWP